MYLREKDVTIISWGVNPRISQLTGCRVIAYNGASANFGHKLGKRAYKVNTATIHQFIRLTKFLGDILGPDYEIVLHDLSDKDNSIVAIANGHISGRTIGAPLTTFMLADLKKKAYENMDARMNYSGVSASGKMLRSSTFFIKDESGEPVGLLCINFDDSRYQNLSDQLLKLRHPDEFVHTNFIYNQALDRFEEKAKPASETFYNSMSETISDTLTNVISETGVSAERLNLEEKLAVIGALEEKGVFMLKGAVKEVAKMLNCSTVSIYRYLAKIRNGSHPGESGPEA